MKICFFIFLVILIPQKTFPMETSDEENDSRNASIELREWGIWEARERRKLEPKGIGTVVIAALAVLFRSQSREMNSVVFTSGSAVLYEYMHRKIQRDNSPRYKFPMFSNRFKKRLSDAFRGGLYASIFNALLGGKEWVFITKNFMNAHNPPTPINGWKVICSYIVVDLSSKYGWDVFKKLKSKPTENSDTKTSPVKKEKNKLPILSVVIKTAFVTVLVNALR